MDEDELLRRFAALRAPSTPPRAAQPGSEPGPSRSPPSASIERAILDAQKEDEELAAIWEGRPLSESGPSRSGQIDTGTVAGGDEELERRLRGLLGRSVVDDDSEALNVDSDIQRFLAEAEEEGANDGGTKQPTDRSVVDDQSEALSADDDIAQYLASRPRHKASPPTQAGKPHGRTEDARSLNREAQAALREAGKLLPPDEAGPETAAQEDGAKDAAHDEDEEAGLDEEDEDEVLREALEEAQFERIRAGERAPAKAQEDEDPDAVLRAALESRTPPAEDQEEEEPEFSFPALPTHTPQLPPPSSGGDGGGDDAGDDAQRRMDILMGLNGPTQKPTPRFPVPPSDKGGRQAGQGWSLPGWDDTRDDDLASWCCICNKDATLICMGCDDDPYCSECWNDGHGPGGEQGHKAKRFVRPRKAMGA